MWAIPPQQSAAFVCHREDVLDVYHRPYDPPRPVVCLDETVHQLIAEVRAPLPAQPGAVERYDCVSERRGVPSVFLAFKPLAGCRYVTLTHQRRRVEWAPFLRDLLERPYRAAARVVLVMDQLNTRSTASLYEAFPPEQAHALAARLEVYDTPQHGSWLHRAEIVRSVLARNLPPRVGEFAAMEAHVAAWESRRNQARVKAD